MAEQGVDLPVPPRHRIDRRAIAWWALRAVLGAVGVVGGMGVAFAAFEPARGWLGPVLVVAGLVFLVGATVVPVWRYAVHRWETTDEAVYALTGWFVREWRVAPISRIQTVDTVRGPLEQALGLATVTVTTASMSGAIKIPGLDEQTARVVTDHLREIAQVTPGDAT